MSVIVTATFKPAVGAKSESITALSHAIAEVHGEDGCELFALHDGADGTLVLIEKWASTEALDAHGQGEPVSRLNAAIAPFIAEPPIVIRMTPVAAGTSTQGTL